jgi:Protein of unknown function (DUF1090)
MAVALAPSVPTNSLKYADLGRTNGYASVIQTLYYSAPSRPNESTSRTGQIPFRYRLPCPISSVTDSAMKLLAAVALSLCLSTAHASQETDACDAHRQALERQMATALNQDNAAQLDTLQAELDKTNAECTPDAIAQKRADALRRHENAVTVAKNRLRDWEAELARARKKGTDQLNIAAWERKVNRARADLDRAVSRPIQ